jgi:hypothetical protein
VSVSAEPLRLDDEDAIIVGYVSDFYELLRAIDEVMPKEATLYLEGHEKDMASEVLRFLRSREPQDPPAVQPNTIWPEPQGFHLPLMGTNLEQLRAIAEGYAEPEVADHLVVYHGRQALLWAHDAGSGYVALSRSISNESVSRFRESLGGALRDRKPRFRGLD